MKKMLVLAGFLVGSTLYAETPVVDAMESSDSVAPTSLTTDQRVAKLEHQVSNIAQMDWITQIANLQQQVQKLQGQLEEQSHQLKQMTEQMRVQYQDLDQRIPGNPKRSNNSIASTPEKKQIPAVISSNVNNIQQEQKAYQQAYALLKGRDYVRAIPALEAFLSQYPQSSYVPNVHYWLGEIYLIQGQPDPAIAEFNTVISQFPTHTKVADSILKIGFAYYDKADWAKAKAQLQKVQKQFPGTPTAQLASARLQELKKQGK